MSAGARALVVAGVSGLVLGAAFGAAIATIADDDAAGPSEAPGVVAEGELAGVPAGPLSVRAERVVLPAGFVSKHRHGGPTFNFVDAGTVVIESSGQERTYMEDQFFFEPTGRVHTVTVLDDARLRVVRLLPPGAEATTEVP